MMSQLTCPHCGSSLSFGQELPPGTQVSCLICSGSFVAAPRATAAPKSSPQVRLPGRSAEGREPAWVGLVGVVVGVAVLVMLGGGYLVWWTMSRPLAATSGDSAMAAVSPGPQAAVASPADEKRAGGKKHDDETGAESELALASAPVTGAPSGKSGVAPLRVDEAMARGLAYLRLHASGLDGSSHGLAHQALGCLVLLECGAPAADPLIQQVATSVRARTLVSEGGPAFQLAAVVLFLDRLGDPSDRRLIQLLGARLLASHAFDGGWVDDFPILSLLGLWVARRHDVPADKALLLARERLATAPHGSYKGTAASPMMTLADLLGLAVAHGVAAPKEGRTAATLRAPNIERGLTRLAEHVAPPGDDAEVQALPDSYFLWVLAQTARIYGLETIDGKDWYAWGAPLLLAQQRSGGFWADSHDTGASPYLHTCLALLFLQRSNLAPDLTDRLRRSVPVRAVDVR